MNEDLTRARFIALPDDQKWGWVFETLSPMAEDYESYRILKRFGVGFGTMIATIVGIGTAILWLVNHIK